MKTIKKIILFIFLIELTVLLTGCSNNENIKDKAKTEIYYLDGKIVLMLNKLNNISIENYRVVSSNIKDDEGSKTSESGQEGSGESNGNGEKTESGGKAEESGKEESSNDSSNQEKSRIYEMVNNGMLRSSRDNIDWDSLKTNIELLNKSWSTILLDLYELNAENDDILNFGKKIAECIVAIKNEDKKQSLTTLSELYSYIPIFIKQVGIDENEQKAKQTEDYIIKAYVLADDINNPEIKTNIQKAIETYSQIVTDMDYTKDKTQKTNKIYVLLNELANSLNQKDSDVFYMNYKNLIEEM